MSPPSTDWEQDDLVVTVVLGLEEGSLRGLGKKEKAVSLGWKVKIARSALLGISGSASARGHHRQCLPSFCLHCVEFEGFQVTGYSPISPRRHRSLLFGPSRHWSFVSSKFEINSVLACWQQQMN